MSPKILVVDDSENIRNVLQMNFEWLGYDVISAGDGEEGMRRFAEEHPDLLILDVMMPRLNGYQVCRQVKSDPATAGIPVILLTAKNQKEDKFWGLDCGADEFITKPFNTPVLEAAVERLLSRDRTPAGAAPAPEAERSFEEAVERKLREGHVFGVCEFRLDQEALHCHGQKYGALSQTPILRAVETSIREVLQEERLAPVTERAESVFRVLLPCTPEHVTALRDRIVERANGRLLDFYDEVDRERGFIPRRDFRSGEEVQVPLLHLSAAAPRLYNRD